MWILDQNKQRVINTQNNIKIFYVEYSIGYSKDRFPIYIMSGESDSAFIGTYETLDESKAAFDKIVKKINLYENVIEVD